MQHAALQQRLAAAEKVAEEQQRQREAYETELRQAKMEMAQAQEALKKSNQDLEKVKSERTKDPPMAEAPGRAIPKPGNFVVNSADGSEIVVDGVQHAADAAAASAVAEATLAARENAQASSEWDALRRQYLAH